MRVLEATQQQVWSHHGVSSIEEQTHADNFRLRLAADDLVPIVTYVISQSMPSLHLCTELAFIERFADEGSLLGEQGYCLATFQAALGCLKALSWIEIEAAVRRNPEERADDHSVLEGTCAAPAAVQPLPTSASSPRSWLVERLARARLANSVKTASQASAPHNNEQVESAGERMREAARSANWDSLGDHHLDAVSPEQPGPSSRLSNRLAARFRTAILPTTPPAQPTARQTAVVRRDEQEEF